MPLVCTLLKEVQEPDFDLALVGDVRFGAER